MFLRIAAAARRSRSGALVALALATTASACRSPEGRTSLPGAGSASGRPKIAPENVTGVGSSGSPASADESVWVSPEACAAALARGERAQHEPGRVRIGTWNVRWFPDGKPGKKPAEPGLDVAWLACAVAWLDVDVLVVQEFKTHPRAQERTAELLARLDAATGGRWRAELDRCPRPAGQHVGLLFDARRVSASRWQTYASLNPHGEACRDQLRPGFGAYLRFQSGLDLHVAAVHLKSGQKRRDYELRRRSFGGLGAALEHARRSVPDDDFLFAGDFNSMGCARCSPPIAADSELTQIDQELTARGAALRRVAGDPGFSHCFGARPTLLDFFVAASLTELPAARNATVYGPCAAQRCQRLDPQRTRNAFAERLSDHCPVVVELDARDKD